MLTHSPDTDRPVTDRNADTCWRELVEIALMGLPAPDFRLEDMIDRIERRP